MIGMYLFMKCIGVHWLRGSWRFQVHISTIQDLYIALCPPPRVKPSSLTRYEVPPSPTPSPLETRTLLSMSMSFRFMSHM